MTAYYIIKIVRIEGSRYKDSYIKSNYLSKIRYTLNVFFAKRYTNFGTAHRVAEQVKEIVDYNNGEIKEIMIQKVDMCISDITAI